MAGASDKARFYLEQGVPELREFEKKDLFTKDEIKSIAKRRSDYEHVLNARGTKPADYAKAIEYEMNLHSLVLKRAKRLSVKNKGGIQQQKHIFYLLDRATRRFQGDLGLWMQYVGFARQEKAGRKIGEILTAMLRLHPTEPDLWIYAADWAIKEKGNVGEARGYFLRGLRFCKGQRKLWLEYGKLELFYIGKLWARRKILGIEGATKEQGIGGQQDAVEAESETDMIRRTASKQPELEKVMTGSLVQAVFDAAMDEFNDSQIANDFFDMVVAVDVPPRLDILAHIVKRDSKLPQRPDGLLHLIQEPLIGIDTGSPAFPISLDVSLDRLEWALAKSKSAPCGPAFIKNASQWLLEYLKMEQLDPDVKEVLEETMRGIEDQIETTQ